MTIKIVFSDTCNDTTSPLLVMDQGEWIPEEAYAVFDAEKARIKLVITTGSESLRNKIQANPKLVLINIPPYSSRIGLEALATDNCLEYMLKLIKNALALYSPAKIECLSPLWEKELSDHITRVVAQDETYM